MNNYNRYVFILYDRIKASNESNKILTHHY